MYYRLAMYIRLRYVKNQSFEYNYKYITLKKNQKYPIDR